MRKVSLANEAPVIPAHFSIGDSGGGGGDAGGGVPLWESSKLTLSFLSGKAQTSHCTSLELRITVRTLPGHDW